IRIIDKVPDDEFKLIYNRRLIGKKQEATVAIVWDHRGIEGRAKGNPAPKEAMGSRIRFIRHVLLGIGRRNIVSWISLADVPGKGADCADEICLSEAAGKIVLALSWLCGRFRVRRLLETECIVGAVVARHGGVVGVWRTFNRSAAGPAANALGSE